MYIKEIQLKDFRNYEQLTAEFHKNVNIFLGQNAQGKTNLLESIYITSMGKSFRTNKDREMIRFGEDFFRVRVKAFKEEELVVEIAVNQEGKKGIKIDGAKARKMSQLLEQIYIVIFSPEDLRIVKDEPEKRRKFIDRELCQIKPSYYDNLNRYKKALLQRNAYLKEPRIDEGVLEIWDAELAQYGSQIIAQRNEFIKKLSKISSQIHQGITNHKEYLEIFYEPSIQTCENQKQIFIEELQKCRRRDIRNRTTGKGPHKDDLQLKANGIDIRNFGSQGQQRTAALSLKLSEIRLIREETGENPILLLDDVLSELDQERQNFLIRSLSDTQIFITTTEISRQAIQSLGEIRYFNIENGKIIS
ncbi:DNA replication/repair protein RecF [Ihubacter massiliensis]|uniref:DNA replication and repair protein RecF n=1 Tax=Hominibacterium faecale TaxID=2839743 RepID=A0A9J6QN49_9FIRM|nr:MULTISPECIES: DNA replication/repair protein RecF [Eubacteriales Family XIII. Incertae Sedis]MCO7123049.1 DNA replication/repair protein RecF [Ihubacter massiliensis]MCU7377309.1 DNA replication/repair protein RecF [Hominibacterium faecale]